MTAQQNPLKILSAKILKGKGDDPDDVRITYIEHFPDNSTAKIPGEFNRQPHPDFLEAFSKLRPHLAVLTDQIDISQVNDEKLIDKFKVHHFVVTDSKNRGFMIFGSKEGKYGRVGLETRNILFESKVMKEEYSLAEILTEALNTVQKEAAAYIRGKHLPDPQGNLFPEATTVQISKPVMFPEDTANAQLYGQEPASILSQAEADAKERLDRENVLATKEKPSFKSTGIPQADPQAMKRLMDDSAKEKQANQSPESVVAQLVADANIKTTSKRKVKQTAEHKNGEVEE